MSPHHLRLQWYRLFRHWPAYLSSARTSIRISRDTYLLSTIVNWPLDMATTREGTLPGKSHGWRSLVGCSPWGRKESDTTERLHFHFLLSCTGEGNGNPLQCSCLENPRDGGAWWTAVYGVAQSRTRLKRLSSSSSREEASSRGNNTLFCVTDVQRTSGVA